MKIDVYNKQELFDIFRGKNNNFNQNKLTITIFSSFDNVRLNKEEKEELKNFLNNSHFLDFLNIASNLKFKEKPEFLKDIEKILINDYGIIKEEYMGEFLKSYIYQDDKLLNELKEFLDIELEYLINFLNKKNDNQKFTYLMLRMTTDSFVTERLINLLSKIEFEDNKSFYKNKTIYMLSKPVSKIRDKIIESFLSQIYDKDSLLDILNNFKLSQEKNSMIEKQLLKIDINNNILNNKKRL